MNENYLLFTLTAYHSETNFKSKSPRMFAALLILPSQHERKPTKSGNLSVHQDRGLGIVCRLGHVQTRAPP